MMQSKLVRRLAVLSALVLLGSFTSSTLGLAPGEAVAQQRKRKKPAAKKAPAEAPAAEKAPESKPAAPEAKKEGPEERVGPASLADMRRKRPEDMTREDLADQKRTEAIEQLKKIIPKISNPSQKADLFFQLAELWWEKSKYVYFVEMEAWDKEYEKWLEATNRGEEKPEPVASHRESELYRTEAIKLYRRILKDFETYPRNDEVLFNLAFNMYETDKKDEGVALYWDLIKRYPRSRFVPDAYLQMGEHFFTSNDVFKAQKSYQKAYDAGDERIKVFATYKLAWCDYNLGEHQAALKKFKLVVEDAELQERKNPELAGKIQMKEEAFRDMVLTYSQLDAVEPAIQYYESHAGKKSIKWIARLADTFYGAGKNEEAILTYRHLLSAEPYNENAPSYQANVVRAYANLQEREQVLAEMQRLVDLYGPSTPWAEANKADESAIRRAYNLAEGTQRELVTEYHQEARKTKYAKTYRLASEIYKRYLEKFADSEHGYNLRYRYAEILFTLREFENAATQYLQLVEIQPDGEYTLEAAYVALLCYEELACIDRGDCKVKVLEGEQKIKEDEDKGKAQRMEIKKRAGKDDKPEEIPKWEQKQIEASDAYVKVIDTWREKNAKKLSKKKIKELETDEIVVRYKAAFLYYVHLHYVEAAKRFEHIILKWPEDKNARVAADLVLDSLNTKEEWAQLNDLARKFRSNKRLNKSGTKKASKEDNDFGQRLDTLIEGSQFKLVMGVNEDKRYTEAAPMFRAFVDEFPKSQYADVALFNAMVIFDRAKELDKAIDVGRQLEKTYDDSELLPRVIQYLGSFYDRIADYEQAAAYYKRYFDDYRDKTSKTYKKISEDRRPEEAELVTAIKEEIETKLPDSLFNAALWYEGLGDYPKAIAAYLEYVKTYEKRDDVPDIFYNVGLIYEAQKDHKRAANFFEDYAKKYAKRVKPWQVIRAKYRAAQAYDELGDDKNKMRLFSEIAKAYPKLAKEDQEHPVVRDAIAQSDFLNLDPAFDAYLAIKFDTVKQKELKARLDKKTLTLAQLEKDYTAVLARGSGDWGICALTRIGLAYKDLARNLLDAPIPPGLDADQEGLYISFLEEKAFPLEDKAIEALEKALSKGHELSVYNKCTLQAQEVMLAFRPNAFGEVPEVKYFGSEFFLTGGPIAELKETPIERAPEPPPAPAMPGVEGEATTAPAGTEAEG
ncbi:MAG: tetratricopeptide repeat protein [Deltaproteobacteria bacterium]|nr:tetratricopeptide repeat protein [Deltaproteobacteria bacterium]